MYFIFIRMLCTENNRTPLHVAVKMGKMRIVEQLLEAGADVHAADKVLYAYNIF